MITAAESVVTETAPHGAVSVYAHDVWASDMRDMLETLIRFAAVDPRAQKYVTAGIAAASTAVVSLPD